MIVIKCMSAASPITANWSVFGSRNSFTKNQSKLHTTSEVDLV